MTRIGLISDTHGLLRPEALSFLDGVDEILHAGDFGDGACLLQLGNIAPLTGVLGNVDYGVWADDLPIRATRSVAGLAFFLAHREEDLSLPAKPRPLCALFGHSHKPALWERKGILYCNPGSVGPRRFSLPISIGDCQIENNHATFTLYSLDTHSSRWTPFDSLTIQIP